MPPDVQKIAEKEQIKVNEQEILQRVQVLANMYQMAPDKFLKDLQKRNGLPEIVEQVTRDKVLEFLANNAQYETVQPPAGS